MNVESAAKQNSVITIICCSLVLLTTFGCKTSSVNALVPVIRPSLLNVSKYNEITVERIDNSSSTKRDGELVRSILLERLLADSAFARVHDKSSTSSASLGVSGAVLSNVFKEKTEKTETKVKRQKAGKSGDKNTDESDSVVVSVLHNGTLRTMVQLRLRDVGSSSVLYAHTYEATKTAGLENNSETPDAIDVQALERAAMKEITDRFVVNFLPHIEYISILLMQDEDLPSLEAGNKLAVRGDWTGAQKIYSSVLRDFAENAKVFKARYNNACALMCLGSYDEAESILSGLKEKYPDEFQFARMITTLNDLRVTKRAGKK